MSDWPAALIISPAPGRDMWMRLALAACLRPEACATPGEALPLCDTLAGPALLICDLRATAATAPTDALARLAIAARAKGHTMLLICDMAGLDAAYLHADTPLVQLLCEPDERTLLGTLMAFAHLHRPSPMLHDSRGEPDGSQLARLSDELGRLSEIIETLVRDGGPPASRPLPQGASYAAPCDALSAHAGLNAPRNGYRAAPAGEASADPRLTAQNIRALLRARRLRDQLLPGGLFADPAWDILLDLMAARLEKRRVSVSSLCIAAFVPPTTALRWIKQLTDQGLLRRQADDVDGRRAFISLSEEGARAVEQWFAASRDMLRAAAS